MFVITMYRAFDEEKMRKFETHSYVLGVYHTLNKAKFYATVETFARSGKYQPYCTFHVAESINHPHSIDSSELGWIDIPNDYTPEIDAELKRVYGNYVEL